MRQFDFSSTRFNKQFFHTVTTILLLFHFIVAHFGFKINIGLAVKRVHRLRTGEFDLIFIIQYPTGYNFNIHKDYLWQKII